MRGAPPSLAMALWVMAASWAVVVVAILLDAGLATVWRCYLAKLLEAYGVRA
jgi:hypothetical protein